MRKLFQSSWFWIFLAAALRAAFVLRLGGRFYQIDEGGFVESAWRLASLGTFGPKAFAPAAPAFFAVFFWLFGKNLLYARLGQAVIGVFTVWLIGRTAEELSGSRRAGMIALAVSAVYPFFIYYGGMLLSETLYIFFLIAGLRFLCRGLSQFSPTLWQPILGGLGLALAALTRPEGAPISLPIWLACGWFCLKGRWSWRALAVAVLFWLLPLAMWSVRNRAVAGTWKLDDHGGINLLFGSVVFDSNEIDTVVAMQELETLPFYQQARNLPAADRDTVYASEALSFIKSHPKETLRQWGRKFVNFWRFYPRPDKTYAMTTASSPNVGLGRWALILISLAFEPWLIIGGILGLYRLLRRVPESAPLALFILGTMAVHVIIVSQMRYRLPVMPLLIVGAAVLAADLAEKAKSW